MAHFILRLRNEGCCGGITLPASAASAIALLAVHNDHHMAHLTRSKVCAVENMSVHDDAASNARAERDRDEVLHACSSACFCFTEGCAVCVVFKIDRLPKALM